MSNFDPGSALFGTRSLTAETLPTAADPVARKLALQGPLWEGAHADLNDFLGAPTRFAPGEVIAPAGGPADLITIVATGFACRSTVLADGRRQIHAFLLPGDAADLECSILGRRHDNVEAIGRCLAWLVPRSRLTDLPRTNPRLSVRLLREAALSADMTRAWVVNLGARPATERLAHLLCELCVRMDAIGLRTGDTFPFPFTQSTLAEAQGVSPVHINRVFQHLRTAGLVSVQRGWLRVLDWERLVQSAGFEGDYLYVPISSAA
jgi:CRP-like cAMP-binding protein